MRSSTVFGDDAFAIGEWQAFMQPYDSVFDLNDDNVRE